MSSCSEPARPAARLLPRLRRLDPDVPIALVERELVGGECSYYACMPTKALLRPGEALAAARNVPGAAEAVTGSLDTERVFWHRDQVTSGWDDSGAVPFFTDQSIDVVRGEGRVVEPGLVRDGRPRAPVREARHRHGLGRVHPADSRPLRVLLLDEPRRRDDAGNPAEHRRARGRPRRL